jgi:bis(5'-nucleosidyl)-tetraphosphatase
LIDNKKKQTIKEFSAGVVIFREKEGKRKYLVLHYPGGHFDFPKGHLEDEETERQAALRELKEETGLVPLKFYEGFMEVMNYSFRRQVVIVRKTVTYYLASSSTSEIQLSHEHKGYLWLDFEAALAKITFENARSILRKSEEFLRSNPK